MKRTRTGYRTSFLAVKMQEGGRMYAYIMPVLSDDNLAHVLRRLKGVVSANIWPDRRTAQKSVDLQNAEFKEQGVFMFD